MNEFLTSNEWPWCLARTVAQGVLDVVVANVDMLVCCAVLDPTCRAVIAALIIAVLTPIRAELDAEYAINSVPLHCNLSTHTQHLVHFTCPGTEALRDKKLPDHRRTRPCQTREQ